ncbi:MAG: BatA domain-containing protein [Candidatus Omnitrophica bacterium]|nr:BatA domain-containing protein [Candidatus Omnitrophota bacterium]
MTFLSPLALVWLGSIPVLIWLWRYAASRRQIRIASLAPFEHLLRRTSTHRTRLIVNWLFWLQLACLALTAFALSEPVWMGHRARTTLAIIDTSASMTASLSGPSPFQRAKQELMNRIGRKAASERFFLIASAPATPLTMQPTADTVQLQQLVAALEPSDVGGTLALAGRIGRALVNDEPDAILILTDEPAPSPSQPSVEVQSFGRDLPNVAIVGADLSDPLCLPAPTSELHQESGPVETRASGAEQPTTRVLVMVQNFSDKTQAVRVVARAPHHHDAVQSVTLEPQQQQTVPFSLPALSEGLVTVRVEASRDALALDNQFVVPVGARQRIPVAVASRDPSVIQTIGRWLEACPRITWSVLDPSAQSPNHLITQSPVSSDTILITDHAPLATQWSSPSLLLARRPAPAVGSGSSASPQILLTHWLIETAHPLTSYIEPLGPVAVSLPFQPFTEGGEPVLWGVVEGRKIPLVLASGLLGPRRVTLLFDPTETPNSVPITLVFFNSLRWLSASRGFTVTGEPLSVGSFEAGAVRIQRPDGRLELRDHAGGVLRYDAVDRAGRYRFEQGRHVVDEVVNFVNPVESNTMKRVSTWSAESGSARSPESEGRVQHPLAHWLIRLLFIILLVEWWLYSRRRR